MYRFTADGHIDYPHLPGGLLDCPHPDCETEFLDDDSEVAAWIEDTEPGFTDDEI